MLKLKPKDGVCVCFCFFSLSSFSNLFFLLLSWLESDIFLVKHQNMTQHIYFNAVASPQVNLVHVRDTSLWNSKSKLRTSSKLTLEHEKPSTTQVLHPTHKVVEFSSHMHQNLLQ